MTEYVQCVVSGVCWDALRVLDCVKGPGAYCLFSSELCDRRISANLWISMMGRRASPGSTQQRDTMEMLTHVLSFPPLGDSLMDLLDTLLLGIFVFIMIITLIEKSSIENFLPSFSFSPP